MEDKTILTNEQIQEEIIELNGWIYKNHKLQKQFQFFKFPELINFLKKVIETMDIQNHHSDIKLDTKNKILKISVTTHSEKAITKADISFIKELEKI